MVSGHRVERRPPRVVGCVADEVAQVVGEALRVDVCVPPGAVARLERLARGAAPTVPRGRSTAVPWSRPAYVSSGWVVRRHRAADVLSQWAGGALPALTTTAFLAPEPAP
jgi:hypothetical protein